MKRLVFFVAIAIFSMTAFGQKGYSDFDTVADVLVKTKISHANSKDDSSPLELSLYFQNNGTRDVVVRYEIYIENNDGEIRHSGKKEVKLRHGQKQFGKISNLTYTMFGTNIDDYASGERKWYFKILKIKDLVTGEVIATSEKIEE